MKFTAVFVAVCLLAVLVADHGVSAIKPVTALAPTGNNYTCDASTNILQLLAAPFQDVTDARERLTCLLQVYYATDDPKGVFLCTYLEVTIISEKKIAEGYFHNNTWVNIYTTKFADFYRLRVTQFLTNDPALPGCWKIAFTAIDTDALIVQSLMLGINSHITYDLAFAIAEVGIFPHTLTKYADHNLINKVLDDVYEDTILKLAEEYSPALKNASIKLGKLDDFFFSIALRIDRELAWRNAEKLIVAKHLGPAYTLVKDGIAFEADSVAHLVLALKMDKLLYAVLEAFEGVDKLDKYCDWFPSQCP